MKIRSLLRNGTLGWVVLSLSLGLATAQGIDLDGDGVENEQDNCPLVPNPRQGGATHPVGDACSGRRVSLVNAELSDNGDDDGFADTRETVQMRLTLRNIGADDLTGVVAQVFSDSPNICITDSTLVVGDLPAGLNTTTAESFTFHVGDVERVDVFEDLSVSFRVVLSSDQLDAIGFPAPWTVDLDLDLIGGSGPTTFVEDFEGGAFGGFEVMNLDAGMPGSSNAEGLANADGYRCQTHDPDWPNSNPYGQGTFAVECYPGANLNAADAIYWQQDGVGVGSPDGGRAFSGSRSLYHGVFLPAGQFTSPTSILEAIRMTDPIYLGAGQPQLSFWHQASLMDDRSGVFDNQPFRSGSRAVVQVQLADESDAAIGVWMTVAAHRNGYDQLPVSDFDNCMFDPIDDGHDEDDFFDPTDPGRRLGPSSTCYPELAFSYVGNTESFDANAIGYATEGLGVAGSLGTGTWIRSEFDLSRWRGRRIRVRFLVTGIKVPQDDWESQFGYNPTPVDDGWWLDAVTIAGAVSSPAQVVVDTKGNGSLPGPPVGDLDADGFADACDNCVDLGNPLQIDGDLDGLGNACDVCPYTTVNLDPDGDGVCNADGADNCPFDANPEQLDMDGDGHGIPCDCADGNAVIHPGALELNDGVDNQCPGDAGYGTVDEIEGVAGFFNPNDLDEYSWPAQPGATRYQVARAASPDFAQACALFPPTGAPHISDGDPVPVGGVRYYVVRSFLPNVGSWGQDSAMTERDVPCAP